MVLPRGRDGASYGGDAGDEALSQFRGGAHT